MTLSVSPVTHSFPPIINRAVAEKRLHSLPPEAEEYTQLWNALTKTVGIVEICLPTQTYKVSLQQGGLLGGFGSSEHFFIGEKVKLEDQVVLNRDDVQVRFGHIIALAGDFYGVVNQPISLSGRSDEDKGKRFLAAFNTLENADPEQIKKLIQEIEDEYHEIRSSAAPHHCYGSRLISSNNRFQAIKGDIEKLLVDNSDHFSENAKETYFIGHTLACREAVAAKSSQDQERLKRAYALEAFACHFLTDLFAAGHIRNQRGPLELFLRDTLHFSEQFSKSLSSILTGAQHEYDGERGLEVNAEKGGKWRAYGDGFFFTPKNKINQQKAIQAVQDSIDEVTRTYESGSMYPTEMKRRIPQAESFNHDPLYRIENGQLFIFKDGEQTCIENKNDYLLKGIPLGLSVLPESYINGFINAYLFPLQGELPQELSNIRNVLKTIIAPRVERLTRTLWHVAGVASYAQLKEAHEEQTQLTKELLATAKATYEQGEQILKEIHQIAGVLQQDKLRQAIDQIRDPIKEIQASFSKLENPALNDKQVDAVQENLLDQAMSLSNTFQKIHENSGVLLEQPLLQTYTEIRFPKESLEIQKIEATRWFRQILLYQTVAFSTYLTLKYRSSNDRQNPLKEIRHFEQLMTQQVNANEDFILRDALFYPKSYIDTMRKNAEIERNFLAFIESDQKPLSHPELLAEYEKQTFEISYRQIPHSSRKITVTETSNFQIMSYAASPN